MIDAINLVRIIEEAYLWSYTIKTYLGGRKVGCSRCLFEWNVRDWRGENNLEGERVSLLCQGWSQLNRLCQAILSKKTLLFFEVMICLLCNHCHLPLDEGSFKLRVILREMRTVPKRCTRSARIIVSQNEQLQGRWREFFSTCWWRVQYMRRWGLVYCWRLQKIGRLCVL